MPKVQQIKTSVRGNNLLPGGSQLFAAIGKLLKLDDFWTHSLSLSLGLWINDSWRFTDLRDGVSKNGEKKNKTQRGNIAAPSRLQNLLGSHGASRRDGPLSDAGDRMGLTHVYGQPFLFAIARDARTIIEDSCRRSDNRDALRHDIRFA